MGESMVEAIPVLIEREGTKDDLHPHVVEELEDVKGIMVMISAQMSDEWKKVMIDFLRQHKTTFAWSYVDMEEISPQVITHRLSIAFDAIPVR